MAAVAIVAILHAGQCVPMLVAKTGTVLARCHTVEARPSIVGKAAAARATLRGAPTFKSAGMPLLWVASLRSVNDAGLVHDARNLAIIA